LGMPLAAVGIPAVLRPRWGAWALAITILPVATLGPALMVYAPPAFLAAGLLRAAIPGFSKSKFLTSGGGGAPISGPLPRA
jgi:hypothetical protein